MLDGFDIVLLKVYIMSYLCLCLYLFQLGVLFSVKISEPYSLFICSWMLNCYRLNRVHLGNNEHQEMFPAVFKF